jgi:hypothetical protein
MCEEREVSKADDVVLKAVVYKLCRFMTLMAVCDKESF